MPQPDLTQPQRQPAAALLIVLLKTIWGIFKSAWPILLVILFRSGSRKSSGFDQYEIIGVGISFLALVLAFVRWWTFRFHIVEGKLTVQKGWLQKETVVVPLDKIQSVNAEAGLLHQMLGVTKLSVDTAGDTKTELSIDAVHEHMVAALRAALQQVQPATAANSEATSTIAAAAVQQVLQLKTNDLLKLSLSANHLETAAIIFAFVFRLFDDLRQAGSNWLGSKNVHLPEESFGLLLFTAVAVLLAVVFVSSLRIFLKYYGFTVQRSATSFFIRQGLLQVRQREIAFKKITAVTWRANPLRWRLGLWLTEFVMAGGEETRKKHQVDIPVTTALQLGELVNAYHVVPTPDDVTGLRIHWAYTQRRTLFLGLLPAAIAIAIIANWAGWQSLLLLAWPAFVWLRSLRKQKRFRAFVMDDVLYLNRSVWGRSYLLLQWQKIQKVELAQGWYAQQKKLANIKLRYPGGSITLPYISLPQAQAFLNFVLYKVETDKEGWQ